MPPVNGNLKNIVHYLHPPLWSLEDNNVHSQVLVMHGGLFSQDNISLADIKATERDKQPPEEGIMCELLWSDPQPSFGRSPSKRGVGCQFGPDVTRRFLENNNLEYIIRSHEVKVGTRALSVSLEY